MDSKHENIQEAIEAVENCRENMLSLLECLKNPDSTGSEAGFKVALSLATYLMGLEGYEIIEALNRILKETSGEDSTSGAAAIPTDQKSSSSFQQSSIQFPYAGKKNKPDAEVMNPTDIQCTIPPGTELIKFSHRSLKSKKDAINLAAKKAVKYLIASFPFIKYSGYKDPRYMTFLSAFYTVVCSEIGIDDVANPLYPKSACNKTEDGSFFATVTILLPREHWEFHEPI